jgi:hypothetical protein
MGDAIHIFNTTNDYDGLFELMEYLPYDEWETLFYIFRMVDEERCAYALERFAYNEYDPGWIFNCVRLLDEFGWLDSDFIDALFDAEKVDYDLWLYLNDMQYLEDDSSIR